MKDLLKPSEKYQEFVEPIDPGSESLLNVLWGSAYRTLDENEWRRVADELMEISPIVVMDTRHVSPSLVYECRKMVNPPLCFRAIFVIGDDKSSPLLDLVRPETLSDDQKWRLLSEGTAVSLVRGLKETKGVLANTWGIE